MSERREEASPQGRFVLSIADFGALGDGQKKNTEAIQRTIDTCADGGGGTVFLPAGRFLTGAIRLRSDITLYLDAGATILFSQDFDDYPTVRTRSGAGEHYAYCPLLYGCDLSNIAVTGRGVIDGQGGSWWTFARTFYRDLGNRLENVQQDLPVRKRLEEFARLNAEFDWRGGDRRWIREFQRPPLVRLQNCTNVYLSGNTHQNSPCWNTHLIYCDNVCVDGVTFLNPHEALNGDGLDVDSCTNVRVSNCYFKVKDDCLCLKSGRDEEGRSEGRPTENITITNCVMKSGHGSVVMGSEMSGGIRRVVISNCVFDGVPMGIRIKTNRKRGGAVEDILVTNIMMTDVIFPFIMHAYYGAGSTPEERPLFMEDLQPVTEMTPILRNFRLSNITVRGAKAAAAYIHGLPEMPVSGISFTNVSIEMTDDPEEEGTYPSPPLDNHRMAGEGIFLKYARDISFRDVTVTTRQGASLFAKNVESIHVVGVKTTKRQAEAPLLDFENVTGALVDQCGFAGGASPLLRVSGSSSQQILVNTPGTRAADAVLIEKEVSSDAVMGKGR